MPKLFIATILCMAIALSACLKAPAEESGANETSKAGAAGESASQPQAPAPTEAARYEGPLQFVDVTSQAGIHFKHNSGAYGKKYLPETVGSGCAFIDYDNDGWQDILLINSTNWPD